MALGDFTLFHDFYTNEANGVHDLGSNDIRLGLITTATTPAATDADPHFGGTGTTDLSTNETTGGEISAGGIALTSESSSETGGTYTFDSADISVAANASNPSDVRWGILYDNTDTNKRAIGFLDFGSVTDIAGGLTVTINANGWFTKS